LPDRKYTSKTVENEFRKKLEYSVRKVQRELLAFLREQKGRRGTDTLDEAGRRRLLEASRGLVIGPFLASLLPEIGPSVTCSGFDERVRDILHQFLANVLERQAAVKTKIDGMEIESWLRVNPYDSIQRGLRRYVPNRDDVDILLDAHDLACTQNLDISFVTGDKKDIKRNEAGILGTVRLGRIVYLAEYEPGRGS